MKYLLRGCLVLDRLVCQIFNAGDNFYVSSPSYKFCYTFYMAISKDYTKAAWSTELFIVFLKYLLRFTNLLVGGGVPEHRRALELSQLLGVNISPKQVLLQYS